MTVFDDLAGEYTDDEVAATLTELRSWLAEVEPTIDPYDPVVGSILLAPLAVELTKQRKLVSAMSTYGNLSPLPSVTLSDSQLLELRTQQAAAFGLSLGAGSYAVGDVRITLSSDESVVIQAGSTFSAGGIFFSTTNFYLLVSASDYTGDAEQVILNSDGNGNYSATIQLTANSAGVAGNVGQGTAFQPVTTLPRFVSAVASSPFVGGTAATDLAALLRDAFDSLVPRTMGSRDQIISLIRYQPEFSNLTYFGVIGSGDPEMQRDKVGLIPLGIGRTDIYAAASTSLSTREVLLPAIAGSSSGDRQTLTIAVDRNVAPGFYQVAAARTIAGLALTIDSVTRGLDLSDTPGEATPVIENIAHGTFSRYQTATVVVSGETQQLGLAAGSTTQVALSFVLVPNVAELQSFVGARARRYPGGDTLVRAAVPVFLEVIVSLASLVDDFTVNEEQIVERIVNYIQSRPLRTMIYGSEITAIIADLIGDSLFITGINFAGRLVKPDGSQITVGGTGDLSLNFDAKDQLSARTIAMYLSASDVRLQFNRIIGSEVP